MRATCKRKRTFARRSDNDAERKSEGAGGGIAAGGSLSTAGFDHMSSARKRAAIQKANNEADHLRRRLVLAEYHAAKIEAFAFSVAAKADALQARIDELMFEHVWSCLVYGCGQSRQVQPS